MTYTYFSRPGLWIAGLLLAVTLSCSKSSTDAVTPADPTCQLTTVSSQSQDFTDRTSYTYDAKGLLVSSIQSSSTGGKAEGTTTHTYTYDADGYRTTDKLVYPNGSGSGSSSIQTTYEYTNGRLTKSSSSYSDNRTENFVYSYDASGNIAATTSTYNDPQYPQFKTTITFSFSGGVLTSGTSTGNDGKPLSYTIASGHITAIPYSSGTKTRYTYDANGHKTKQEGIDAAGVVTDYIMYEFATTPLKIGPSLVVKGFPSYSLYGTSDLPVSRETSSANGYTTDTQFQYQANSKGYIFSRTGKVTVTGPNYQNNYQSTQTYTYANCQ